MFRQYIRKASKKDSEAIAELASQLGYPCTFVQIEKRLEKILNHPENIVLTACISEKVVGWIHVFINYRVESDSFAELGGLVVDEKNRGSGIGQQLCAEAEQWAFKKGLSRIRVRSNVLRKETHKFYLNLRYKEEKEQKVFGKKFIE